jgi:hypothetical protein
VIRDARLSCACFLRRSKRAHAPMKLVYTRLAYIRAATSHGWRSSANELSPKSKSVMTFLRIVIPLYLFDLSMIFSENRYPLFRIML